MKNNKLVIAVTTSIITATSLVPVSTFADEVVKKDIPAIEQNIVADQEKKYAVKKLPAIGSEELKEYDKDFKVPISKIETNGKNWSNATIDKAIDGDINTNWHAGIQNSDTHTNEVIMTLDKTTVVDRLSYYSPHTTGFAHEFEVYVSQEATGDNFTKVAEGEMTSKNDDNNEIRFKPVKSKRVKLVYKRGGGNWAVAYELGVYKEDTLYNEVRDLFKDEDKMILADKYVGNIQAIEELNEKAKGHVLYSNIKVFIDDAMAVVKHKPIKPVKAITGLFEYKDNKEYLEQFKVTQNNIKGISNNAGHYVSQVIENAADGKLDTYFETNRSNSDNWKNEITLELNDREVIDSIVIGTRYDGKGAAENVEILVSNTSQGDNFELVSTAKLRETSELSEIKFNPVESKRIKLRYINSSEDWVTLNEFWVFKEDKIRKEVEGIFVDGTMMELKDEYNSIEAIEALEAKISNHLLKPMLGGILEDARKILDNRVINDIYVAKQDGDMAYHAKNILKMYRNGQNYQVTGYAAQPGDILQIYVDIDEKDYDKTPSLMMSQNLGSWSGWGKTVPLKPGKNIIVVPDLPGHNEGEKKGGALYIMNPYTPEEQGSAPKIRIVGANKFPVYREGDSAEEFRQELIEYKKKLDEDNTSGAGKVIDIMEFDSKRVMISGTTTAAYNVFVRDGNDPANTVKKWNADMEEIYRFHGLDGSSSKSDPKNLKEHVRVMDPYGSMYAVSDHVGIQPQHVEGALSAHDKGWGMYHEIGHRMEVAGREHAEVTNNMTSMAMTAFNDGRPNDRMFFEEMYVDATREDLRDYNDRGGRSNLGMYWQLELYQDGIWAEIEKEYRGAPRNARLTGDARENFIRTTCKVLNEDVTEFFEKSGFKASDALDKEMSEMYRNSGKKLWYLNNDSYRYKGEGLPSNTEVSVEVKDTQGKLSLRSNVPKGDLLGYEIVKDGKVIGFTSKNTFQDPNYDASRQAVYTVKAYGHKLDSSKESVGVNSHKPLLNISQSEIYIALNDKFQPLDYIQALDYTGTDISKDVVVETDLDNKVRGTYDVKYTVVANGQTNTKTIKANVVSDIQEVSELDWKRGSSGWLSIHKDKAINSTDSKIKLNVDGNVLDFNKGLSVASHSEIVYDIAEKGYTRFISRVGAEMFNATDSTSVKAKVYLDGVEAFASDLLTVNTESVLVDLNLEGVKEVKLVIEDGGNGGRDDVASWGNPLFINSNSKPTLDIGTDLIVKSGKMTLDEIVNNFKAEDLEDGDLTSKVVVSGHENINPNKFGEHTITYTVTDSDDNTITKSKNVLIVSELAHVSDLDWKRGSSGWLSIHKDKAINSTDSKIKLNVDGNVLDFNKGLSVASHSEIVYDIAEKGYTRFISRVGAEMFNATNSTSVKAKVYLDGVEAFASDLLTVNTESVLVDLNLEGVKEVKLVIEDGGNGGRDDVASWGNPLFISSNSKPTLDIGKNLTTKVGQSLENLVGEVSAQDMEDGDLTAQVKVTLPEYVNYNKPGEYIIKYEVTDSDGNKTTKTKTLAIVDMKDAKSITDYDWKSAVQSYSTAKKDTSAGGQKITLSDENLNPIEHERGIGAHATSTIIYDLSDKNYEYFTSYVGVEHSMRNSIASVEFQVYVDGIKAYDSGLMRGSDGQKFVEVDINGAKELKLVVTDGGNGQGSDNASWGSAKLHYVNADRADTTTLIELIEKIEAMDITEFTEESVAKLNETIAKAKELLNQELITNTQAEEAIVNINKAVESLETSSVDITIPDGNLERIVRSQLSKPQGQLTSKDMETLTELIVDFQDIKSIEGLQYAKNLETLDISFNEINDLSPLGGLKKLKNFNGQENFTSQNIKLDKEGNYVIDYDVIDVDGKKLNPVEIIIDPRNHCIEVNVEDVLVNGKIVLSKELVGNNLLVDIKYESKILPFEFFNGVIVSK